MSIRPASSVFSDNDSEHHLSSASWENESLKSCGTSTNTSNSVQSVRGKASKALQPLVPPPDVKNTKKIETNDSLNILAKSAEEVARLLANEPSTSSPDLLDSVRFALNMLPDDKKIPCIIDLLRITLIYADGREPIIE